MVRSACMCLTHMVRWITALGLRSLQVGRTDMLWVCEALAARTRIACLSILTVTGCMTL